MKTIAHERLMDAIVSGVYKNSTPDHFFPLIVKIMSEMGIDSTQIAQKLKKPLGEIGKGLAEYMELEKQQSVDFVENRNGYGIKQVPVADGVEEATSVVTEKKLVENYLKITL